MAKVRTGIGITGLSGTSGGLVFATQRDGTTIVRERPFPTSRTTEAQQEARRLFAFASAAWRGLTVEEQRAWQLWARRQDPLAGPSAVANAYRALAIRWYGANGTAGSPPSLPPAGPFGGDAVEFAVAADAGALTWTADRANAAGVVTELSAARVQSALAEPRDRDYRTVERVAFAAGGQTVAVARSPGRYAVGVRFVLRATGQAGPVLRLGVVRVG